MDNDLFQSAITKVQSENKERNQIGILGEKTTHAVIKNYLEPLAIGHEVKLGRFYADIVCEDGIIEIQTRDLYRLKEKLKYFLAVSRVTLVHPIPHTKHLCWVNCETGEITTKRKSPKLGKPWDCFIELYGIKSYLKHVNLSICLMLIDTVEYRNLDGWGNGGKRGSSRNDRVPLKVFDEIYINCPEDYLQLIPPNLPESFTTKDFMVAGKTSEKNSQCALNVLEHMGVIRCIGKNGRRKLYTNKSN